MENVVIYVEVIVHCMYLMEYIQYTFSFRIIEWEELKLLEITHKRYLVKLYTVMSNIRLNFQNSYIV